MQDSRAQQRPEAPLHPILGSFLRPHRPCRPFYGQSIGANPNSHSCLAAGAKIGVLAKIESADSVSNLEDVLDAVDGAMVARGDLGAELPVEQVPFQQSFPPSPFPL